MSDTVRGSTARARPTPARRLGGRHLLRQAIRMTARDWRAGELTMLLLALVLAVAALSSVGFLADRLHMLEGPGDEAKNQETNEQDELGALGQRLPCVAEKLSEFAH